ncbi:MAG: serine hydrolase [Acidobacteria bacterium]|nr:serine hydrolase [Acidobacteriota bacterium]
MGWGGRDGENRVAGASAVLLSLLLAAGLLAAPTVRASEPLPRASAADHQVDANALSAALNAAQQLSYMRGMVVVRDGAVIGEGHWSGTPATLHQSRSVTKSVTSILLGIAIDHGFIKEGVFSARLVDYLPPALVPSDPAKREIKLFHLLMMISGLQWNESTDVEPWLASSDPVGYLLSRPLAATPGASWNDDTAAAHLLSVVITQATGMSTLEFADEYLFGPLGITDRSWESIGGCTNGGRGLWLSTEDLAKLGVLFVNGGSFNGKQIVSRWWTNISTNAAVINIGPFAPLAQRNYGLLWWIPVGIGYDAYTAWGYGGQFIFCVPGLKLVVATHARYDVSQTLASQQERGILGVIVNRIIPAAADRRVFTVTGVPVPELAGIDTMMQGKMQAHAISRATAALTKEGRLVFAHGYTWGEPDVTPTEPTATFRIGSVSKMITSVAIHQLIERGLLSYDTPVAATLGLAPPPGGTEDPRLEDVTLDNLLTHTVGWDKYDGGIDPLIFKDWLIADTLGTEQPPTRDEIATFMAGQPMQFDPGTRWAYCNFGYMLLELLAEHVTGVSFPEWVQESVFRPIGVGRVRMGHSLESERFPGEPVYDGLNEGDPYTFGAENAFAAGTMVMATPDLAKLLSQLFDTPDAGGLLSQQTLHNMLAYPFPAGEEIGYGRGWFHKKMFTTLGELSGHTMGWFTDPASDDEVYGHTGQGPGQQAVGLWNSEGVVFAVMVNKDSVIQNFDDLPVIPSWPQGDLWASVGITEEPAGSASTETWIPVVAHNHGVGLSAWRTDVNLLNRSPLANKVRVRAYAADGPHDLELSLGTGEARTLDDILVMLGTSGTAPLRVFSSEELSVSSRTYSVDPTGTFGQALDGECGTCGLGTGDSVVLMQLREDASGRSNIGILNGWRRPAVVRITLYDGNGVEVVSFDQTVPPEQTVQVNRPFRDRGGRSDIGSGYAIVKVLFGRQVVVYGSVIDAGTNDPTTIPMHRPNGSTSQWIAAAAHGTGVKQSVWRTDLALLNLSSTTATAQVRFHLETGTVSMSVNLAPRQQVLLGDVVAALGATGTGTLEIVADAEILATSRTYNAGADGTLGQFLGGIPEEATAGVGVPWWILGLHQNSAFRTNIGLANTGTEPATVRVTLFDADGSELANTTWVVAAGATINTLTPFKELAGRSDITSGYARVDVEAGAGIIAYGSVIDNHTNDPTTVAARR